MTVRCTFAALATDLPTRSASPVQLRDREPNDDRQQFQEIAELVHLATTPPPALPMQRLIMSLALCAATACSASTRLPAPQRSAPAEPTAASPRTGHASINVNGLWGTGSVGEPTAKQIVLHPQCNYSPSVWILEQNGDSVRAWMMPESWAKGTATTEAVSTAATEGGVSGADLTIGTSDARYLLHYDSTSGHLRGTFNGAPFWAVRLEIVRPERCIPVP